MKKYGRIQEAVLVLLAELFAFSVFVLFLRVEHVVGTIVVILAIGGCWYLFDRSERVQDYLTTAFRHQRGFSVIIAVVLLVALPVVLRDDPYLIHICLTAGIYVMLATGLNYQLGSTNIVNLATAASYGVGAYTSALLSVHTGAGFWLVIFAAGGAASFMGFLLGLPTTKTKDYYLSLVTIAFGLIVYLLLNNLHFTGGPNGIGDIPAPSLFGHSFRQGIDVLGLSLPFHANYYYLVLSFCLVYTVISQRLHDSRTGLTWNAIREDEIAARCSGIHVANYKILSFCINCFLDGVTGAVYAHYVGFISPENFQFMLSVVVVTMVILGGMDNVFGVVFGAVLLTLLPEKFRIFEDFRLMMYGVIVITTLVARPQGLFPQKLRKYG
ncbi:MAG: branched-chain amino acid ABC transporter permease [Deltaproteobacteria bacterium]|nr:branched-chain amino acid ABC transporter permease [Deltaproteobacteria bacterium]MBW2122830.1 branched-chain amino acid ABC transporter permease [Deltaproteobacteria bacterium]